MKTSYIASKTGGLFPLIMAVIFVLLTLGCEEADYIIKSQAPNFDTQESNIESPWRDSTFVVDPSGTYIITMDGNVGLRFVEGAVLLPTKFHVDSYFSSYPSGWRDTTIPNLQIWGLSLQANGDYNYEYTFNNKVRIWMTYDQFPIGTEVMLKEDSLTIYRTNWRDTVAVYESISNCYKNFSSQKISGIINRVGIYIVGEK